VAVELWSMYFMIFQKYGKDPPTREEVYESSSKVLLREEKALVVRGFDGASKMEVLRATF